MRRYFVTLTVVVALVVAPGCGRKLDPLPPIVEVPETTTDLRAVQIQDSVVLTWSYPVLTRAGRNLTDLQRVSVWRLDVPSGQEGAPNEELRRQLLLARGTRIAQLEGGALVTATRGPKLTFADPLPTAAGEGAPPTLWYAVRSRRADGTTSALSNIVSLLPKRVPAAVTGVVAAPGARGIALSWDAVAEASYLVERREPGAVEGQPLTPTPVPDTGFEDTTAVQGKTWVFAVRAVVEGVVGPPSESVEVTYPDVYPPPEVEGLVCLPEPERVRLTWDPSADVSVRYTVLRRVGSSTWTTLEENGGTGAFVDESPPDGQLEYAIRAVDAQGNESSDAGCRVRVGG